MVSTRHHPSEFPPPDASPTKTSPRKTRNSTASPAPFDMSASAPVLSQSLDSSLSMTKRAIGNSIAVKPTSQSHSKSQAPAPWAHTASNITLAWLAVSIPLVIWDALYILLRPHTFAGGKLQWPLWKPYEIYARVDHVYGPESWAAGEGFGGAQGAMNAIEVVLYVLYAGMVMGEGKRVGAGLLSGGRRVEGKKGNRALVLGFSAAVMTLSKTMLYYLNETYSGFSSIKHNDWPTLIALYGVMNGLWIIFPAYMTYVFSSEIISGLDVAVESSAEVSKKSL